MTTITPIPRGSSSLTNAHLATSPLNVHPPVHPAERHNPEQPFSTPELVSITNLFVVPFSGVAASSISNSDIQPPKPVI